MPTRKFNRSNIRWRSCEHCSRDFPDSRKNRRFCNRNACKRNACRRRKRDEAIAAAGGKCIDCGRPYDADAPGMFCLLSDGSPVCRKDFSRRSRER